MCAPSPNAEQSPEPPAAVGAVPILEERNDPRSLAEACALSIRLTCRICGRDTEPELSLPDDAPGGLAFLVLNVSEPCWYCKSRGAAPATPE